MFALRMRFPQAPWHRVRSGMDDQFAALRPEILRHCYRMLGSAPEAEDAVQDAMLKAWSARASLRDESALRAWLYRIATHVCLDRARGPRVLPHLAFPPADDGTPPRPFLEESIWVGPFPSAEELHARSEHLALAFVAALQHLPARQRAALLLRDVVELSARETAEVLEMTPAAVEAALQRARATMEARAEEPASIDERTRPILERYAAAWHARDASAFVSLLAAEAEFVMPPTPVWFRGRDAVGAFVAARLTESAFRLVPLRANERPGFALYRLHGERWIAHGIQVIDLAGPEIARIHTFLATRDDRVFGAFGLDRELSPETV